METFIMALEQLFNPFTLLALFGGVIGGIIAGALPGLTATMGVAILVPFTFSMPAVPGILMLLGLYAGAIYGGSIAAILIRTPGTPSAAATVLDGSPLFEKGEGGRALGIATLASVFGGIGSSIFLIFLAPLLSRVALSFSAPEYFALAVFGLTIIASISGDSMTKGLLSGFFGLLIATIGIDPIQGYGRFTFGTVSLLDGVAFIPALIGLFAFAEVLNQFEELIEPKKVSYSLKNLIPSLEDVKTVIGILIKSTFIGTFVGALPGAGGDIASFVCYNEAKRSSKYPEKFGTGIIEGVAAAESGNNSSTGGALIPTLSLGIPGDSVTAVIIGALMIQGLRPGPLLFRDNLDLVYSIFMGIFGLMGAGLLAKIVTMSKRVLMPIVMVLAVVGSFAISNSIFDIGVMMVLGVIGYLMQKIDIPMGPIVLALILGPMAESNFRRAVLMSRGSFTIFLTRPISLVLIVLSLISLAGAFLRQNKDKKTS